MTIFLIFFFFACQLGNPSSFSRDALFPGPLSALLREGPRRLSRWGPLSTLQHLGTPYLKPASCYWLILSCIISSYCIVRPAEYTFNESSHSAPLCFFFEQCVHNVVRCDFTNLLYQHNPLVLPFDAIEECMFSVITHFLHSPCPCSKDIVRNNHDPKETGSENC